MTSLKSETFRFSDYEEAQEYYHQQGLTDGLPIVLPTSANVQAMLDAAGLQPSDVIATETVRGKTFIAEKVAINAVMAGCKPEYMPVVVACVEAMSETAFNFHANSTSTNGVGLMAVISGPIAKKLGINSSTVALGHGFRANATIGRALGLLKINVYGSVPHQMDKSTLGHPGKYTFCFAENDDVIPWEPLRVEKGFSEDASTVTLFASLAPLQVSTHNYSKPEDFLSVVSDAMRGLGLGHSEVTIVLSPEILAYVGTSGWSKKQIKEFIHEKTHRTGAEWNQWFRSDDPFEGDDLNRLLPVVSSSDKITVVGAGGDAGAFASIIGSWGGIVSITKEIK